MSGRTVSIGAQRFAELRENGYFLVDKMGLSDREGVKEWYDGFTFGPVAEIYNPWSITHYLDEGESYELSLVNREVRQLFARMARRWLEPAGASYNIFTRVLVG